MSGALGDRSTWEGELGVDVSVGRLVLLAGRSLRTLSRVSRAVAVVIFVVAGREGWMEGRKFAFLARSVTMRVCLGPV